MAAYHIDVEAGNLLRIRFGEFAQNDRIVRDASERSDELLGNGVLTGGEVIRINGPASLPVGMVIARRLGHLYQAVACYDPKLDKYVVAIAQGDKHSVGDLLD